LAERLTVGAHVPANNIVQTTSKSTPSGIGKLDNVDSSGRRAHGVAETDNEATNHELRQLIRRSLQNRAQNNEESTREHADTTSPAIHDITTSQTTKNTTNSIDGENSTVEVSGTTNLESVLEGLHGVDGADDGAVEAVHDAVEDAQGHHEVELDLRAGSEIRVILCHGVGESGGLDGHFFGAVTGHWLLNVVIFEAG
jgi:hypothetical protein